MTDLQIKRVEERMDRLEDKIDKILSKFDAMPENFITRREYEAEKEARK
jgi:hypothetical protein